MGVFVVGDGLLDIALKAVNSQVHLCKAYRGGILLQPVKGEPVHRVFPPSFHKSGALDEHSSRTTGRVQNNAIFWFQNVGDERNQRNRGEELTSIMGFKISELGQKVFVDTAENIAIDLLEFIRIQSTKELTENIVVQFLIFAFGEHAPQVFVIALYRFHGFDDGPCAVAAVTESYKMIELCLWLEENCALLGEVLLGEGACLASPPWQGFFDGTLDSQEAAVGMAQEDQPHYGKEILVAGKVGVRPQRVRRAPESFFDGFDVFELGHVSSIVGSILTAQGTRGGFTSKIQHSRQIKQGQRGKASAGA